MAIEKAPDTLIQKNYLVELPLFVKMVSFILWTPRIRRSYIKDFKDGGYVLKDKQSGYYSFVGCLFCVVSLFSLVYDVPFGYLIWPAGFLPAYLFDVFYYKERLVRYLQKKMDEGNVLADEFA